MLLGSVPLLASGSVEALGSQVGDDRYVDGAAATIGVETACVREMAAVG